MEYFYRQMRKETGYLMDGDDPQGGQWNYDKDNRRKLPKDVKLPQRLSFEADSITKEVLDLVGERFDGHFGDLHPFTMPVTRSQALKLLDHFITDCLPCFGDYQDAMAQGEAFLFHSLLSASMNAGLLLPREVCDAAQAAFDAGRCTAQRCRGLHPADPWLARICARPLLAENARLQGSERA
jgi:deoxyribodipyrimidine photolyase-related protein